MNRITLEVGSFEVNCTLLEKDGKVLVIDPGQKAEMIADALAKRKWIPSAILLTHGHFDHINAIPGLLKRWPALPVGVTQEDAAVMAHPLNAMPPEYNPVMGVRTTEPDKVLSDFAPDARVIATPGHTPGGVCYYFPSDKLLFSGDTLFAGSVGRTDFPGGDMATLIRSLAKLKALPPDTQVIPGHGMFTTIGDECAGNPFMMG